MYFEFEEQHDNPQKAKLRFLLMGVIALLLLVALSVRSVIPSIEKDLSERITATLVENDLNNILITVKGRDVIIKTFATQKERKTILEVIEQVHGIRKVTYDDRSENDNPVESPSKVNERS